MWRLTAIAVPGVTSVDTENGSAPITLETIDATLRVRGGQHAEDRAKQHYLALLLNVASARIMRFTEISADGRSASQALQYVADLILDGDASSDELAKDISETLNDAVWFEAGMIPDGYDDILYRVAPSPSRLGLRIAPNPGSGMRAFHLDTPVAGEVSVEIFDVAGRKVATVLNDHFDAGSATIRWDDRTLGAGVYFARLKTPKGSPIVKLVTIER